MSTWVYKKSSNLSNLKFIYSSTSTSLEPTWLNSLKMAFLMNCTGTRVIIS